MSRFRRALHGVASSYVLLAATAIYSLASVPVALYYLAPAPDHNSERFGLWVVMGTLMGYLTLIDAGMTSAAARLLIDYKDDRNGGGYGSLIKTGWLVSILQGASIFIIGFALAGTFASLLAIQANLQPEFIQLLHWQCGVVALAFSTRMFSLVLTAHQRMDIVNGIGAVGLGISFAAQWFFFHLNFGVLSLALGALVAAVLAVWMQASACLFLKLLPQTGHWGRVSWQHFCEIFNYGKDVFLVGIGSQLIMTSQTLIITRMLGLEAAAAWGIGMRMFNLLNQVVWRIYDMSASAFAEMLARGELARLHTRYRSMAVLTFSLASWTAVSFGLCNSLFIGIWTHDRIHWPVVNDWLLAVWMILSAGVHCHNSFVLLTKQIAFMRYIYFLEGVIFVILSFLVLRWSGLAVVILCSILCTSVFSYAYGIFRVSRFFELTTREVALAWLQPMGKILLYYLPVAGLLSWAWASASGLTQLVIHVLFAISVGGFIFLRFGLPPSFQNELLKRIPNKFTPFFKRVFLKTVN